MVTIHNTDLFKELKEAVKLQQLNDFIPSELARSIVPVVEVNPKLLRRSTVTTSNVKTTSGTTTILTTDSTKQFFITAFGLDIIKNAACDMGDGRISLAVTINGATQSLGGISVLTLTAQNTAITGTLDAPLKIDVGSTISLSGSVSTFTAGACIRSGWITGYYDENIRS